MKKLLLLTIILLMILAGCSREPSEQIVATTLPVYEFTNTLCGGTGLTVSQLVTEDVSCLHDYTVQVSQMRAVESSEVVVCNGAGLEEFLEDVLSSAKNVIDASAGIALSCGHSHEEEHHHEYDPHIWLSPANAKIMCKNICDELSNLYPEHAGQFQKNLQTLLEKLDALQAYGKTSLADLSCRNLITFHDGFAGFAESFDLHILKAVEEESGSEASARELIEIIDLIQDQQLPAIFTETNGSTAAAELIARETGIKIYTLDMAISGSDYFTIMYRNIDTIKEALQ
ncbi:MAG: zinc ABC transporter substrate-binding protein [Oscillospiraceae bacterium]|nr:zinc ABC transporter substrate-binding protein [Oscillospiraceae bacterium]